MITLSSGVYLHVIKSQKFKTNRLVFRFSSPMSSKRQAARALLAQILVSASQAYPTSQVLRQKLASLYGAQLSSRLSSKGKVHILDLELAFLGQQFLPNDSQLLTEVLGLILSLLREPLLQGSAFDQKVFDLEQSNLIAYLEADQEDSFYASQEALKTLFYEDKVLAQPKYASPEQVAQETPRTVYEEWQTILATDQLDIFLMGDFDEQAVSYFEDLPFAARECHLTYSYYQDLGPLVDQRQKKALNQSVLAQGYHLPKALRQDHRYGLQVFNGLFGGFFHSKLFRELREKAGLAYSIGSQLDSMTGLLYVYAGTASEKLEETGRQIAQQLEALKAGDFTDQDLEQTKTMLKNNLIMAEDLAAAQIERAYNRAHLKQTGQLEDSLAGLDRVSRKDIMTIARQLVLQANYHLEGE